MRQQDRIIKELQKSNIDHSKGSNSLEANVVKPEPSESEKRTNEQLVINNDHRPMAMIAKPDYTYLPEQKYVKQIY